MSVVIWVLQNFTPTLAVAQDAGEIMPWIRYSMPSPSHEPNGPKVVQNIRNMKNAKIGSAHTRCSTIASIRSVMVSLCSFGRLKQARTTSSM